MKYFYGKYINDGQLDSNCGRIVIYEDELMVGYNQSMDHNYLLRAFAAKYRFNKDDVINNAIRLYFVAEPENDRYVISPVRKIDDDMFERHMLKYGQLIRKKLR
jgi:hypothetical protein